MLVQWTPFGEVARLQAEMARLFDGPSHAKETAWNPSVDVAEDQEKIVLSADLPGVDEKSLDIQVEEHVLTLKGERKLERTQPQAPDFYRRYERVSGTFSRAFRLPETVDAERIGASLKDGILTVTLPKRPEAQPQKIKISVGG